MSKKIIQIDLDGVLNEYKGNYISDKIDIIKSGAFEFIEKLSKNYSLELFTVRDISLCKKWLKDNNLTRFFTNITNIKNPLSSILLDDRAINFNGNFEEIYQKIINFKPYWKE